MTCNSVRGPRPNSNRPSSPFTDFEDAMIGLATNAIRAKYQLLFLSRKMEALMRWERRVLRRLPYCQFRNVRTQF